MHKFLTVIGVVAGLAFLWLLMPSGWARRDGGKVQGLNRLGDEHLHIPERRKF